MFSKVIFIYNYHIYLHFITVYGCKNTSFFMNYQIFSDKCAIIERFSIPLQTRGQVDTFADL